MFMSAKMFFEDNMPHNERLLIRAETDIPAEFIKRYKRNVVKITPMKSGALRRSIITLASRGRADISWRSAYAKRQNEGGHSVTEKRVVYIDGKFVTLMPGFYRYSNYTTPGTGPHFANVAFQRTRAEMPPVFRELGLTK